ncbi:MAG: YopX family protein [Schleiferilactobacillus perolens]|uniref:YopX family protein n=1 Tax=Schleiferilactobacillus perolens TaxID=100468 RepID=UPI0039EC5C30
MKREIKFRGWRRKYQCWEYGYLIECPAPELNEIVEVTKYGGRIIAAVERDSIGQYTGLHDKNGREIYEGDIVKLGDTASLFEESPVRVAVVKFDPDICFDSNVGIFDYGRFAYKKTDEYLTVIGNIYENPELLEDNDGKTN